MEKHIKGRMQALIEVSDPKGYYDPAQFAVTRDHLLSWCPACGIMQRDDLTLARLEEHLADMISEGLEIRYADTWLSEQIVKCAESILRKREQVA